jgi:hypothetical protein
MTRSRENADGARLDAPLASPVLVTPNLGTPSAGVMTNATGIPAAQVSGVLPSGVTGGSGLTALGTVASGNLGAGVTFPDNHVIFHEIVKYGPGAAVTGTSTTFSEINSALRITHTGASTDNIFIFEYACGSIHVSGNQMFINVAKTTDVTTGIILRDNGSVTNIGDISITLKSPGIVRGYYSAVTSAFTYTPIFRMESSGTGSPLGGLGNATFTLMELKK